MTVRSSRTSAIALFLLLLLVTAGLAAFVPQDEDRPVIIVSSGSVILSVSKGAWVPDGAGRFRQELPNGRDVQSFSASTGAGAAACTVAGASIVVTYGTNTITFERTMQAAPQMQRRRTDVRLPANANVTLRDGRSLVIATNDALVSVSNSGNRPQDRCAVAGGQLEIRQVH